MTCTSASERSIISPPRRASDPENIGIVDAQLSRKIRALLRSAIPANQIVTAALFRE
jgi:hypothetical protein